MWYYYFIFGKCQGPSLKLTKTYFWSSSQRTSWDGPRGFWRQPRPPPLRSRTSRHRHRRRRASWPRRPEQQLERTWRPGKPCARPRWTSSNDWRNEGRGRGHLVALCPSPRRQCCRPVLAHSLKLHTIYCIISASHTHTHIRNKTFSLPFDVASGCQVAVQLLLASASLQISKAHFRDESSCG